ncbi:MAG: pilin [Gammaproteobacteria bacterium]
MKTKVIKFTQAGASLVELMIVVAIIGILAALAIPAYQDYTIRAKVSEVLTLASKERTTITEYFMAHGSMPTSPEDAGINMSPEQSEFVAVVSYSTINDSTSELTFTLERLTAAANDKTIVFEGIASENGLAWKCSGGSLPKKYLPVSCRGGNDDSTQTG